MPPAPLFESGEMHPRAYVGLDARIKILLEQRRLPLSSRAIWQLVLDDYGEINLRTVYRRLRRLAGSGEIALVAVDHETQQHFYTAAS